MLKGPLTECPKISLKGLKRRDYWKASLTVNSSMWTPSSQSLWLYKHNVFIFFYDVVKSFQSSWDSGWYALDFMFNACLTCWNKIVKVLIIILALIFLSEMASGIDGGSHTDTRVHYYFVFYKTFVIFSFFFFLSMIPSLILYILKLK